MQRETSQQTGLTATMFYLDDAEVKRFLDEHHQVIEQAIRLVSMLSNDQYNEVIKDYVDSSIGQHLRHVIDHYNAIKESVNTGKIDFDVRNRQSLIATCSQVCIAELKQLLTWLSHLSSTDLTRTVEVSTHSSLQNNAVTKLPSTVARELLYVSSHSIHHYSLIAIICKLQGIQVVDNFGVAPATLEFLRHDKTG